LEERCGAGAPPAPPPPPRNLELLGLTPSGHVLRALRAVRPSDVDQVLLTLPFSDALRLLRFLLHLLRRGQGTELCSRAALLLLRVHQGQLAASARRVAGGAGAGSAGAGGAGAGAAAGSLLPLVVSLKAAMQGAVRAAKDQVGFIVAGLRFLDRGLAEVEAAADFSGVGAGPAEHAAGEKRPAGPGAGVGSAAGSAAKAKASKRRRKAQLL
jgi:U3 small nucleolar RNA-associated protein 12